MFKSKSYGDIKKLARKFVELKRTTADRFKYLKILIDGDGFAVEDLKGFFEQHYQHVYFVFYDMFAIVEQERRSKNQRTHKDDLEFLLVLFEKILVLLPNLIQRRWQFQSIRRLLKQLLHSGNSLKLRKDGMRLFIIWYQILQNNNDTENHQIYSKLVTLFQDSESYLLFTETITVPTTEISVVPVEVLPLTQASSSEKGSIKTHKFLMESVLTFMVSEVVKIQWDETSMQESAFRFLFTSFRTYYLDVIFPNFNSTTSVYSTSIDQLPEFGVDVESATVDVLEDCQDVVIRWFATFVQASRSSIPTETNKTESQGADVSDLDPEGGTLKEGDVSTLDSKTGTLTNGSIDNSTVSSVMEGMDGAALNISQHNIVYKVLLSDRDNVNIVHEIFRQAFMLPLTHAGAVRRVVLVYKDWLQVPETRPQFMEEPTTDPSKVFDEVGSTGTKDVASRGHGSRLRSIEMSQEDIVRAGLQNSLLLFIKHSAFVFMINPNKESLSMQVDLCRRVLNIYRYMVMNIELDNKTWEQLLVVLLKVTSYVLGQEEAVLGKHLSASLLQTLIVSWIKANLCIHMPQQLWDQLLSVLSSLCHWEELIKEWAKTMETLTRVLAKQVYQLDLADLPLDRLSEQKSKRQRGKMPPVTRVVSKKGTFSRAYSRFDSATAFRAQLLSRTSNQDSEETIDECDDIDGEPQLHYPRGRASTDINAFFPQLTRSSSDGNLSGSMDKLKIGSTGTLVSSEVDPSDEVDRGDTLKSTNQDADDEVVENGSGTDPPISTQSDDHIPMSITDHNLIQHSNSQTNVTTDRKSATHDDTLREDGPGSSNCGVSRHSSDAESFISTASSLKLLKAPGHQSFRNGARLSSEGACSIMSESEASEDTNSMISLSEYSESLVTPTPSEGQRSHSSSPTSNDLTQYLPDDMASFLKQDSITTSSSMYDAESLKHAASIDKDSITIDEAIGQTKGDSMSDERSVLTGGQIPGWTPDVAVVLWRRMLGILGDVHQIKQHKVHEKVMEHLLELQDTLIKLSDNMNVCADNAYSQEPGEITSPVFYFFPACFKCLSLGSEYIGSKVLALQMMAKMCLRHDYQKISPSILTNFYQILHKTLISTEQPLVDVLVRHCALLFGLDLPGSNLFIMDVLNAATSVLSMEFNKTVPRREAIALLGSLVCFPNHFGSLDVLTQGSVSKNEMEADQLKEMVLAVLLDAGRKEPAGLARCVALSSLGIFLVEEMLSGEKHPKFRDAVNVLLVSLRFNTELVARVACDMLLLLSNFVPQLAEYEVGLPVKIVSTIVITLQNHVQMFSQPAPSSKLHIDKLNVIESIMFCLLRWCMNLPLDDLIRKDEHGNCLIGRVLKILQAVSGGFSRNTPGGHQRFSQEYDLESLMSVAACTNSPIRSLTRADAVDQAESEENSVSCASRFVMRHLVNLVSHFPSCSNPTRTYTSLQECNDLDITTQEMSKEVFESHNLQMFVFNRSALITVMEMAKRDVVCPIESTTIPTTTARILIRDLTGRYSASATLVYERMQTGPTTIKRSFSQNSITDNLFESSECGSIINTMTNGVKPSNDPIDKILRHIAISSPECQLQPGEPLDIPCTAVDEMTFSLEDQVKVAAANHEQEEINAQVDQKTDFRLKTGRAWAAQYSPSTVPYTVCRQLLNQLGYLSWETRLKYHLLNKTDKLLREIKHLDSQSCRETHKFAVVYVSNGQEDKQSILSNSNASPAFERFISNLGWEVDLATHEGFIGGLQRNGTNGATAPYYCDSTLEVMYHVSTRMPAETEDDRHRKLRHIGNDEVHVIWSEHYRPYRRGIIPTDFGDVMIIIYPLKSGLYRIQIDKKPEILYFGPLFDGAIVSERVLPILVRCTAVNASRIHRLTIPHFKPFFQVRIDCLEKVIRDCKSDTTFETFTAGVYAPSLADQEYAPPHLNEVVDQDPPLDLESSDSTKNKDDKDELFGPAKMIRRLSMRGRKSSARHISTPPDSPKGPPRS